MKCKERPKVVLVPYPAQGHVTPMLHLGSAMFDCGFDPVMVTPEFLHHRIVSRFEPKDGISFVSIPDGLDKNEPHDFFAIGFAMENHMPVHLERVIHTLNDDNQILCVIVDLLASWAIEVSNRCGVRVAGFWPAMLATYRLITAIPCMTRVGFISESGIPKHNGSLCYIPGQQMVSTEDLPWLVGNLDAQKSRFMFWLRVLDRSSTLQCLVVNSFPEECDIKTECQVTKTPPNDLQIFQVAPLSGHAKYNSPSLWEEDRSCLDWLDKQKPHSVVYVSFGSWVSPIGEEKMTELALGLEAAGRPFIWVLSSTWKEGLPSGYMERNSKQGKVVSWAPQMEVLQHKAVGCYLTHCGWNSTMEAIQCGKALLCYPVAGDQFMNCKFIVKVWRIGLRINGDRREDVEKGLKRVKEEGKGMHQRVMDLKERVMGKEGSSRAMDSLIGFIDNLKKLTISSCTLDGIIVEA